MKHSEPGEFRELVGKLSDGVLSGVEADRLNEILKSDEIAREAYLDHLFVDGLLEREFSGSPLILHAPAEDAASEGVLRPSRFSRVAGESWIRQAVADRLVKAGAPLLLLLIVAVAVFFRQSGGSDRNTVDLMPLQLADASFENSPPKPERQGSTAMWLGDGVKFVREYADVEPLDGKQMLHFVTSELSPDGTCDVYQIVDLHKWRSESSDGEFSVTASANFNALAEEGTHDDLFGINLYAFSETPVGISGLDPANWPDLHAYGGRKIRFDSDTESWQDISTSLNLPPEARYLVLRLFVLNSDGPPGEDARAHFADKVELSIVSSK